MFLVVSSTYYLYSLHDTNSKQCDPSYTVSRGLMILQILSAPIFLQCNPSNIACSCVLAIILHEHLFQSSGPFVLPLVNYPNTKSMLVSFHGAIAMDSGVILKPH